MKKIVPQSKLQKDIRQSMKILSDIVGKTLGPGGLPILIERSGLDAVHRPLRPLVTKDGVTVARSIQLKDRVANTIVSSIIEVAEKTNMEAGDGTTTAIVLANAIYEQGQKAMAMGERPETLYQEVIDASKFVLNELDLSSYEVKDKETIKNIATISANGDETIGEIVAEAFDEVGDEGVITLEDGYDANTKLIVEKGFKLDKGLIRPDLFYTHPGSQECILNNCRIIIYDGEIDNEQDLVPVLSKITNNFTERNAFLIVARDVRGGAMNTLVVNRMEQLITNFGMVKAPNVGNVRTEILKDLAVITNGKMIIPDENGLGSKIRNAELSDLGFAKKVVVTKYKTLIYGGDGTAEQILERVEQLKESKTKAESPYDAQIIESRIGTLTGGIAVIKVGGKTDLELKEKKDRIEDALNATRAAIQEGIVPGGGAALFHISGKIEGDVTMGAKILREAIKAPMKQMLINIGENPEYVIREILSKRMDSVLKGKDAYRLGFDGRKKQVVDMIDNNIIDPVKVTRTALLNALSIANLLLTCGGAVVYEDEMEKTVVEQDQESLPEEE